MSQIKIGRRQVQYHRFTKIPQLLKDIVDNPTLLGCKQVPGRDQYIIGVYDGATPPNLDYRNWRFRTLGTDFRANYFEIWYPMDTKQKEWYLYRAYLTLFKIDRVITEENPIVALHCDPSESDDEPHAKYKKGPHIHMLTAGDPLHHSHISLNNPRYLNSHILTSFEDFSIHLSDAMKFLSDQVIQFYD